MGIKQIRVSVGYNDDKVISWMLDPKVILGPVQAYVEFSKDLNTFERLNSSPITDKTWYVDTIKRRYSVKSPGYYRVIIKSGSNVYTSESTNMLGVLSNKEYNIAKNIMTQYYKYYVKGGRGVAGKLLQRMHAGAPCTTCRDFDTGEVVNTECTKCYGTGIIGGYYKAVPYYVEFLPTENINVDVTPPLGVSDSRLQQCKAAAYPIVDTLDVFVEKHTNKRYVVKQTKSIAEMRGIPLIYTLVLGELPGDNIISEVPCG